MKPCNLGCYQRNSPDSTALDRVSTLKLVYLPKGGDFMAKKKKRYRKRKKRRCVNCNIRDTHHLCYQRKNWQRGHLRQLRDYWYCKVLIPRDTLHKYIHQNLPDIPAPKDLNAKNALEQLEKLETYNAISEYDSVERRLKILAALFDCCDQDTADAFRKQLALIYEYKKPP